MDVPSLIKLVSAIREAGCDRKLILFGSCSALASYPDLGTMEGSAVRHSRDADFVLDPWDDDVARQIHDRVGARKSFDVEHGFYADIIRPMAYENFPPGWQERLVPLAGCAGVFCLEPHDMAVAKCFPARPKDRALLVALIQAGRLSPPVIRERLSGMPLTEAWIVRSHRFLQETAAAAGQPLPP
jgi:hypothetical protein